MRSVSTRLVFALVLCGLVCLLASPAFADVLFYDSFENKAVGSPLTDTLPDIGTVGWYSGAGDPGTRIGPYAGHAGPPLANPSVPLTGAGGSDQYLYFSNGVDAGGIPSNADMDFSKGKIAVWEADIYVHDDGLAGQAGTFLGYTAANSTYAWGTAMELRLFTNGTVGYFSGTSGMAYAAGTFPLDEWVHVQLTSDLSTEAISGSVGPVTFSGVRMVAGNDMVGLVYGNSTGTNHPAYSFDNVTISAAPIPEPSTLVLLATGLFGLLAYAWRKRR